MKKLSILALLLLLCSATPPTKTASISVCKNKKVSLFLNRVWKDAELIAFLYNIPLELVLAQTCQETGYGTSDLCQEDCNYFGIQGGNYDSKMESMAGF